VKKVRFGKMLIEGKDLMLSYGDLSVNQLRPKNQSEHIGLFFFIGNVTFSMEGWEDIRLHGSDREDPIIIRSGDEIILYMTFKERTFQVESFFKVFSITKNE